MEEFDGGQACWAEKKAGAVSLEGGEETRRTGQAPATRQVIRTALLAGRLLMSSGAETERVQDTIERMLRAALGKGESFDTYVMLNGIFVQVGDCEASLTQVRKRQWDLERVARVNQVSRELVAGGLALEDAHRQLLDIERTDLRRAAPVRYAAAAVLAASIVMMFGGTLRELPSAIFAGFFTYLIHDLIDNKMDIPFLLEFFSVVVGGLAGWLVAQLTGADLQLVFLASIIPLVPGIGVTNSLRDIVARHYLTGLLRFVDSLFTAAALGSGAALLLVLLG